MDPELSRSPFFVWVPVSGFVGAMKMGFGDSDGEGGRIEVRPVVDFGNEE